jgi:hypothetical protein
MKQVKDERRRTKDEGQNVKATRGTVGVFLARGLPVLLFGLVWLGVLGLPTLAAIRATPQALPVRFSSLERINLGWQGVKRQEKDNTCGLAVLSLLLSWAGVERSEAALARDVQLSAQGMSLFDWQELAKKHGVQGQWLRVAEHSLPEMPMPLVAQIKDPTGHFVVVQRVYNGHVLFADPNAGLMLFTVGEFLKVWTGRSFVPRGV